MKKLTSFILAFCLLLSLAACGAQNTAPETAGAPTETAAAVPAETEAAPAETEAAPEQTAAAPIEIETVPAAAGYPVTVTDHAGRSVVIEAEPQRIVSGYYISSSAMIALGLKDRMVGIEAKADKRMIYKLSAPELTELPSVGTAKEFDLEGCLALEPDLVVLPLKLKSVVENLEQFHIPVLLVNPESQTQMMEMVDMIAQAAGAQLQAAMLEGTLADIRYQLPNAPEQTPSVYLAGNSALLSTAGENMYQSDMIRIAGGVNAAAEITDTYWAEISYEQLLAWDPDYILLASDASYTVEDVLVDPNLADCAAVKNGHVLKLPNDAEAWDSPVPSGILGSAWLANQLHPELVSEELLKDLVNGFYSEFYGFTLYEK